MFEIYTLLKKQNLININDVSLWNALYFLQYESLTSENNLYSGRWKLIFSSRIKNSGFFSFLFGLQECYFSLEHQVLSTFYHFKLNLVLCRIFLALLRLIHFISLKKYFLFPSPVMYWLGICYYQEELLSKSGWYQEYN